MSGQTKLELPTGRYRFAATSGDGVRLSVDGRQVIDAWSPHRPRRDFGDLELDGGSHEIRVQYFQQGRRVLLWVRVEPISSEAQAIAIAHGGHALRTLQRAIDEQAESRGAETRATRAALFVSVGRYQEAAAEYAAAIDIDPRVSQWWRNSALLCLVLKDQNGYDAWRAKVLSVAAEDRVAAARTAILEMIAGATPIKRDVVTELLTNGDSQVAPSSELALCEIARGLAEYRAGHFDSAIQILDKASVGRLADDAMATAHFFKAMALHHQGSEQAARELLEDVEKRLTIGPAAAQTELDATEVEDRLICLIAVREARSVLSHGG
jgi:tetratricopeptide (TPR) repeat protein